MQATPNAVASQDDAREELASDSGSHGSPEAFLHLPKACRRRISYLGSDLPGRLLRRLVCDKMENVSVVCCRSLRTPSKLIWI